MLLLAGHDIKNVAAWNGELRHFWDTYLQCIFSHPMKHAGLPKEFTILLYIHGEEGRGKSSSP